MTVAEHKREWFLARRAELHAKGLRDAHIAEQMGVKRAYFSQIVNGLNVSDQVIDRMCSAFGVRYLPRTIVANVQTDAPADAGNNLLAEPHAQPATVPLAQFEEVLTLLKAQMRLTTHNARHSAAQRIKKATDIHTASRILGHATVKQTQAYLNDLDTSEIEDAFRKLT